MSGTPRDFVRELPRDFVRAVRALAARLEVDRELPLVRRGASCPRADVTESTSGFFVAMSAAIVLLRADERVVRRALRRLGRAEQLPGVAAREEPLRA